MSETDRVVVAVRRALFDALGDYRFPQSDTEVSRLVDVADRTARQVAEIVDDVHAQRLTR
jgi:hypothetical protein